MMICQLVTIITNQIKLGGTKVDSRSYIVQAAYTMGGAIIRIAESQGDNLGRSTAGLDRWYVLSMGLAF